MFEYLMPLLFMRSWPGTLLDESCRMAVRRQREWGRANGVPWGSSESAYRAVDLAGEHQYRAFGVPGLGFRRGLDEDLVVAPYASVLAALLAPAEAAKNLRKLDAAGRARPLGVLGRRGLHGGARGLGRSRAAAHVRRPRRRRPHRVRAPPGDESRRARERAARRRHGPPLPRRPARARDGAPPAGAAAAPGPVAQTRPSSDEVAPTPPTPAGDSAALPLPARRVPRDRSSSRTGRSSRRSRRREAGGAPGGASPSCGAATTRRPIPRATRCTCATCAAAPCGPPRSRRRSASPETYRVTFLPESAIDSPARRRDRLPARGGRLARGGRRGASADADESRRLRARDRGHERGRGRPRAPRGRRRAPRVREALPRDRGGAAARRSPLPRGGPRAAARRLSGRSTSSPSRGAARARSSGRRTARASSAAAATRSTRSHSTAGRCRARRERFSTRSSACGRGCGSRRARSRASSSRRASRRSRESALALAQKHHDPSAAVRAFALARTHAQVAVRHLGLAPEDTRLFEHLASCVLGSDRSLAASGGLHAANVLDVSALWRHGISGDLPILTVRLERAEDLALARQTLEAQEYWRLKGLADRSRPPERAPRGLPQGAPRRPHVARRARALGASRGPQGRRLSPARRPPRPRTSAGASSSTRAPCCAGEDGDLAMQLDRAPPLARPSRRLLPRRGAPPETVPPEPLPRLEMANGFGGFGEGGRTYEIVLDGDRETPHPWANVLANPGFGSLVTASGAAMTWSSNSRENRLTPFANDAVSDPLSEVVVVRDEETGEVVGATPGARPREKSGRWRVTHEPGLSRFRRTASGIARTLDIFVAREEPAKISLLTLENRSGRTRRLAVFAAADWALGPPRPAAPRHVVSALAPGGRALLARNPENAAFAGARRVPRLERAPRVLHGRPARVPRGGTLAPDGHGPAPRAPVGPHGRRARPLRGAPRRASRSPRARRGRSRSCSARGGTRPTPSSSPRASRRPARPRPSARA